MEDGRPLQAPQALDPAGEDLVPAPQRQRAGTVLAQRGVDVGSGLYETGGDPAVVVLAGQVQRRVGAAIASVNVRLVGEEELDHIELPGGGSQMQGRAPR